MNADEPSRKGMPMTTSAEQSRPCRNCHDLGIETDLPADSFYCDTCEAVYCPYCDKEVMEHCEHKIAATFCDSYERLGLTDTSLEQFPTLGADITAPCGPLELDQMVFKAFGPLRLIVAAYNLDLRELEDDPDGDTELGNFRAGIILKACLSHLGIPFHEIDYVMSSGMGASFGKHYFADAGDSVVERVTELQGRLEVGFGKLASLLEGHGAGAV